MATGNIELCDAEMEAEAEKKVKEFMDRNS